MPPSKASGLQRATRWLCCSSASINLEEGIHVFSLQGLLQSGLPPCKLRVLKKNRMQMLRSRKWNYKYSNYCGSKFKLSPTVTSCRLHLLFQSKTFCTPSTAVLKPSLASPKSLTTIKTSKQWNLFQCVFNSFHIKALLILFIHLAPLSATYAKTMAPKQSPFKFVSNLSLPQGLSSASVCIGAKQVAGTSISLKTCYCSFCLELHLCSVWLSKIRNSLTLVSSFWPVGR